MRQSGYRSKTPRQSVPAPTTAPTPTPSATAADLRSARMARQHATARTALTINSIVKSVSLRSRLLAEMAEMFTAISRAAMRPTTAPNRTVPSR